MRLRLKVPAAKTFAQPGATETQSPSAAGNALVRVRHPTSRAGNWKKCRCDLLVSRLLPSDATSLVRPSARATHIPPSRTGGIGPPGLPFPSEETAPAVTV